MIHRRSVAAFLTLALAAAPSLLATCKIRCGTQTSDASATPHRHSCPGTLPNASTALTAGVHVCGHSNGEIQSIEKPSQPIAGPIVIAESFTEILSAEIHRQHTHIATGLPNGPPPLHQLRI